MLKSEHTIFRIFTLSICVILVAPLLVQDGMFVDGLFYSCVSKNLALGQGTFWHPHFSETWSPDYHHQPPLMFGLQALLFKIFGLSFFVERLYSLLIGIGNALLILLLWRTVFAKNPKNKNISWLPVLFWIIIPVCFYSIINNLEEITMSIFVLASIYFFLLAMKKVNSVPFLLLSGLMIFFSSLTKGIQGTFTISAILFYWIVFRNISFWKMIQYFLIVISVPIVFYCILLSLETVRNSYQLYFDQRIVQAFNDKGMETTGNRLYILYRLFTELIPVLCLCILFIFYGTSRKIQISWNNDKKKYAIFFLVIGLSGVLPLMVTLEQRGWYLVTSLPYFAICFAIILSDAFITLISSINVRSNTYRVFRIFIILLFIFSLTFTISKVHKVKRDEDLLHDVYMI